MKKSRYIILCFVSALTMNIMTALYVVYIASDIGECCVKDYLIMNVYYYYKWVMLPVMLVGTLSLAGQEFNINRVVRYEKISNIYIRILSIILLSSVLSSIFVLATGIITGWLILGFPIDNWTVKSSYVISRYGYKHSNYSLVSVCCIIVFSTFFLMYTLSCICMIIYRITDSFLIGFVVGIILIVVELGNHGKNILLHYGAVSLTIYVSEISMLRFYGYSFIIMVFLTIVILFMGHGDFLVHRNDR